jgi:AraC-like DNA-binding protein
MPANGLSIIRRSYTPETLHHRHPYRQIVLPDLGRLEMNVDGRTGAVSVSQIAVVEAGQEHLCWAPTPTRCLVIDLPPRTSADDDTGQSNVPFREVDARLSTIAQIINVELATGGAADPLIAEGLGAYLNAALDANQVSASAGAKLITSQTRIAKAARDYVETQLTEEISIAEISVAVGASVSHLQRCFRACFGVSIIRYIHQMRLRRAATLLQTTDLTVIEIAFAVGFADASYLARLFRREYGIAPARFRRSG